MFRYAVACLLLAVVISAAPPFEVQLSKIPADIKALLPTEVVDFYKSLTDEDRVVIKDLIAQAKEFKSEEEAINALKEKSESLYTRAKAVFDVVKAKIDALDTEAKTFIKETVAVVRSFRPVAGKMPTVQKVKELAHATVAKYQALSAEAKADLQGQFPQITKLLQNKLVQNLAKKHLAKTQ
uniref:Fatty-acid and retinol-binding protein 1 n=1 Tax=Steinernema glaseri TaxID=37863 RepID=A0A1I7Z5A7_9BILA